jgi:hypothetical protein
MGRAAYPERGTPIDLGMEPTLNTICLVVIAVCALILTIHVVPS